MPNLVQFRTGPMTDGIKHTVAHTTVLCMHHQHFIPSLMSVIGPVRNCTSASAIFSLKITLFMKFLIMTIGAAFLTEIVQLSMIRNLHKVMMQNKFNSLPGRNAGVLLYNLS